MEASQRYSGDPQAQAVARFMTMIEAPVMVDISACPKSPEANHLLIKAAYGVEELSHQCAQMYKKDREDERLLRARLILEEVGELMLAMAKSDEVAMVDAIADSQYVIVGTAVTFDLPSNSAFMEAHRSNMTKDTFNDHAAGVKGKGPNFQEPDFAKVIAQHRDTI